MSNTMKPRYLKEYVSEYVKQPKNERLLAESEVGLRLTDLFVDMRSKADISQAELGRRVGRSQPYVAKLENGAYDRCSVGTLRTFARAMGFDVAVDDMFKPMVDAVFSHGVTVEPGLDAELCRDDDESVDEFLANFRRLFSAAARHEGAHLETDEPWPKDKSTAAA